MLFIYAILANNAYCQNANITSDSLNKKKLNKYIGVSSVAYGAALLGLNQVWYSGHERQSFHFFNDNREWQQLDKIGHFYSAYQISHVGIKALKSTGLRSDKAYFWGGMVGLIVLTPIEILDGFSAEYGASWGDVIANFSGAALAAGQYYAWDEIRIHPKYSFHSDAIANKRPDILGEGVHEQIIKNYNGMTYWLSFDIYSLLGNDNSFPKWLNLAIGYSGEDMMSGNDTASRNLGYSPYRQYFLSFDLDLTHLKSESKLVNTLLYVLNMVHLPAPALEFSRSKGLKFHSFYF